MKNLTCWSTVFFVLTLGLSLGTPKKASADDNGVSYVLIPIGIAVAGVSIIIIGYGSGGKRISKKSNPLLPLGFKPTANPAIGWSPKSIGEDVPKASQADLSPTVQQDVRIQAEARTDVSVIKDIPLNPDGTALVTWGVVSAPDASATK